MSSDSMIGVILLAIIGWACSVFLCSTACVLLKKLDIADNNIRRLTSAQSSEHNDGIAKPPVVVLGPMYECCLAVATSDTIAKDEIV